MAGKKGESTFSVILKPMVEVISGEPHVAIEVVQPVCWGSATLILSEEDIGRWEAVLQQGRAMIREAKGEPAADRGEQVCANERCGKRFVTPPPHQIYCSVRCSNATFQRRKYQRLKEKRDGNRLPTREPEQGGQEGKPGGRPALEGPE